MCFLSLPPSITVVSEKDNLFNNNNKNYKYDSTYCFLSLPPSITVVSEKDNLFNNNNKNYKYDSTDIKFYFLYGN